MSKYLLILFLLFATPCLSGIVYDGVDDGITSASASINLNAGTLCMKMNPNFALNQSGSNYQIFDSDGARHAFYFNSSATVDIQMFNDGRVTNFSGVTGGSGQMYTLCFVYNKTGNVQKLYVDGVEQTADTPSGVWGSTAFGASFFSGIRFASPLSSLNGTVHEVSTWSSNLTTQQILSYHNSGIRRIPCQLDSVNLLNYWEISDGSDGSSADTNSLKSICGSRSDNATADNGANNTGLTWEAETVLNYPIQGRKSR